MSVKIQMGIGANMTDAQLAFIREMGVRWLFLNVREEESDYDSLMRLQERFARFDLRVSDVACPSLQKNPAIDLGLPGRDEQLERYVRHIENAARAGVPIVSVAWQPNGILRTGCAPGKFTRGGTAFYADMAEINARGPANGRVFTEEEIWENFRIFLERTVPVCEAHGARMALHPNDPPVACLAGVPSLIYNTECYRRAFALAGDSDALAMKLCVGCWLEAGDDFGDLMADIREFCTAGKVACVHLRNVSSTMPYFEETLAEDGYADVYAIVKQFVACGYDGLMSIDHSFTGYEETGGRLGSSAYPTGYLKGLVHAAQQELGVVRSPED